jgi:hypothetical protein
MDKPVYCFIDDSPFELKLFMDVIETRYPEIQFIYANTYAECESQLAELHLYPSLFILDLYGREGIQKDISIPQKAFLDEQIKNIPNLDVVYDGLDKYDNDKEHQVNEFLKRLFSILNEWRKLFSDQCTSLDQGSQYGINNLLRVRKNYPTVTAVMYSRKALFTDAVKLSQYNCDGIFIKPAGSNDEEIYAETKNQADSLIDSWNKCVNKGYCQLLQKMAHHDQTIPGLTKILSLEKHQVSNDNEAKHRLNTLLNSLHTLNLTKKDLSVPEVNALAKWMRYYYSLPK